MRKPVIGVPPVSCGANHAIVAVVRRVVESITTPTRVGAAIFGGMVAAVMSIEALATESPTMFRENVLKE